MSGYPGRDNFEIARMNSGYGNRVVVELTQSRRFGVRWRDAVRRLLIHRVEVLRRPYGYDADGLALVWTVEWDGATALPLSSLDPFFIEICRRVRLVSDSAGLHADAVTCKGRRINAKHLLGAIGDPWIPVDVGGTREESTVKALTVAPSGLTANLLRRIVFGDNLELWSLQQPLAEWGSVDPWVVVSVLVRGQGKTEGFHSEAIQVPHRIALRLFGRTREAEALNHLSKVGIESAGRVEQVLKRAVFSYVQGGPQSVSLDRPALEAWWLGASSQFQQVWRPEYFPWLWSHAESPDEHAALVPWVRQLRRHGMTVLRTVEKSWPGRVVRSYRAQIEAEGLFQRTLLSEKYFPWLREVSPG